MTMGRAIDGAIWTQRRQWIGKQRASGVSVARFCRDHGLSQANFYAWKRKLASERLGGSRVSQGAPVPVNKQLSRSASKNGVFLQVPIPTPQPRTTTQWIEVSNADGVVVRVPAGNLAALKVVLGALASHEEPIDA